jgi:hypothetical protein
MTKTDAAARKQALYDEAMANKLPPAREHNGLQELFERYAAGEDVAESIVRNLVLTYAPDPDRHGKADKYGPMKVDLDALIVAAVLYGRVTAKKPAAPTTCDGCGGPGPFVTSGRYGNHCGQCQPSLLP